MPWPKIYLGVGGGEIRSFIKKDLALSGIGGGGAFGKGNTVEVFKLSKERKSLLDEPKPLVLSHRRCLRKEGLIKLI